MNVILFGLKRSYLVSLKRFNRLLVDSGITCARFDLLRTVSPTWGIGQAALTRTLGLARSTVSRMLRALERRGLVTRETPRRDRRAKLVRITEAGKRALALASEWRRGFWLAITAGLEPNAHKDSLARFFGADELDTYLRHIREMFSDRAYVPYAWHPDDY